MTASRLQSEIAAVLWAHPLAWRNITSHGLIEEGTAYCRCGYATPYGGGERAGDANARHVAEVLAQHLEETCKSTP